jgi:hypothetical protein
MGWLQVVSLGAFTIAGCTDRQATSKMAQSDSDIHETKAAHTKSLMAIPGVVGVAVGKSNGRACIRVYLEHDTKQLRELVPAELDGHPVEAVVTGPFKPMN